MAEVKAKEPGCSGGWRVTVPATSANLGCAFDCAGLALNLHLRASFLPSTAPDLSLQYKGKTPERIPLDGSNLVLQAMRMVIAHFGGAPPRGQLLIESEIPVAAGLGSSAAAVIAGLLLGTCHCGQQAPPEHILRWAEQIEGHVDNAAAAYLGGLVFALSSGTDHVTTLKTAFPEDIKLVVVTPAVTVATHEARRVLPDSYSRADVVHVLQRTALLAATCFSGKFDLFPELFDDRLHQPYRQQLAPGIARCLSYRSEGLLGIAISGSGSSVIAMARKNETQIAGDLKRIFVEEGVQAEIVITSADNRGAVIEQAISNWQLAISNSGA